ncbi:uncharacterized protein Z518_09480 [Rhinocladiella mackenziei CBS 650.93]|uniref:Rhinocladiella mackenziei CBS 650.93 unplaced genomic scaffold supercont1.7, whole genome shotgun sequence n=1 Tax=Rhinocladiella mackenziei CBS 650.93 TaxID=1442369 RepID=A0A0D2GTT8_9EURO|nr:uncharacterized protein Z518_09480 [Rhinocladiella mackenziei CBS 650.93]KIX01753.1 hypothetical protein Z518_09480 [Rhinocladiella mackenziei CBS 650.93]
MHHDESALPESSHVRQPDQDPQSATRRPRPVISCLECRRKKLKCDRTHPCQQCVKVGRPGRCHFQPGQEPEPSTTYSRGTLRKRRRLNSPNAENADGGFLDRREPLRGSPSPAKRGVVEDLQHRVMMLENALFAKDAQWDAETSADYTPLDHARNHTDEAETPSKFDQISSQFKDACSFMTKLQIESDNPDIVNLRAQIKNLHYMIETHNHRRRLLPLPALSIKRRPLDLPPFQVCETLAILYFDNMEHCFRILHWPEFSEQLKLLFTDGVGERACRFGFIPQLVGVLSIASTLGTHQECEAATSYTIVQHPSALKFMNDFLQELRPRQRYLLPALQVKMLIMMCKWMVLDPMDDLFRLNGTLLRDALVMKMDQDPSTLDGITIFEGELRRRNWMTIVECDLMLSILCKLPCMVPPYTAKPPRNINDEEIFDGIEVLPQSRPMEEWTDSLCQYVLTQSFPRRLAACKQMDTPGRVKVDDVLLHTRYLEKVLQDLPPPLRFSYSGDQASKTPPRLMARMELDISIRRPLLHLYSYFASAPDVRQEVTAGFLQSCLMLTTFQDLFDPRYSEINVPRPEGYWDFFYNVYRHEIGQAILGLCLEIKRLNSKTRTDNLGSDAAVPPNVTQNDMFKIPAYTTGSMIQAVKDTLEPMRRRIAHPGAKLKDIFYFEVILTSLLSEHLGENKEGPILKALEGLVRGCQDQLEQDHVPIIVAPGPGNLPGSPESAAHTSSSRGVGFDPSWADFPDFDLFEPLTSQDLFPNDTT